MKVNVPVPTVVLLQGRICVPLPFAESTTRDAIVRLSTTLERAFTYAELAGEIEEHDGLRKHERRDSFIDCTRLTCAPRTQSHGGREGD